MLLNNLFQKKKKGGEEDYAMKPVWFAQSEAHGGLLVPPRGELVEGLRVSASTAWAGGLGVLWDPPFSFPLLPAACVGHS